MTAPSVWFVPLYIVDTREVVRPAQQQQQIKKQLNMHVAQVSRIALHVSKWRQRRQQQQQVAKHSQHTIILPTAEADQSMVAGSMVKCCKSSVTAPD